MKLDEVQAFAAAQLARVPALAALGAARLYSHFEDLEESQAEIAAAIREKGVSFEISAVEARRVEDKAVRGVAADAEFSVYIAEDTKREHTPNDGALRKAVIEAIMAPVDAYTPRAEFVESDAGRIEQGYILQILTFKVRVTVP